MMVRKRSGEAVPFDKQKIWNAINQAYNEVYPQDQEPVEWISTVVDSICYTITLLNKDYIHVEEIQDMVENLLSEYNITVAKAYIRYRYKREVARECRADFMDAISEKLEARNVVNQNANVDEHSFGGRIGEASGVMMRQYALDRLISPMARKNYLDNIIYIHDLDHYAVGDHNCLTIPFDDLLAKGFTTRQTDIRPANSINTAMQLVAVIFQLQSLQQFGGVSASHLDWTMVPYVKKSFAKHYHDGLSYIENMNERLEIYDMMDLDTTTWNIEDNRYKKYKNAYTYARDMTERELQQAVEGMYHNLNTLQSRSGNQLPFTSINYGTCTLPEGRMVIRALLEGSIKGVGKYHKTPIFPCGIFQLGKGINRAPGDPNYDLYRLALESTAKRIYPNYANIDWSGNAGYDPNDPTTYFSTINKSVA